MLIFYTCGSIIICLNFMLGQQIEDYKIFVLERHCWFGGVGNYSLRGLLLILTVTSTQVSPFFLQFVSGVDKHTSLHSPQA